MTASRLTDRDLPPDAFAVVMATAILSAAASMHSYPVISVSLATLAATVWVVLGLVLTLRVVSCPRSALGRRGDPDVAIELFTAVAACTVLGVRFADHPAVVWVLGAVALVAWLLLVPVAVRDVRSRPSGELREHARGAWLLPSVATAGLAITAADLALDSHAAALIAVAAIAWPLALGLYVVVTGLIFWRAASAPMVPEEITPDSWVLMGALAIVTLAGDHILAAGTTLGRAGWLNSLVHPATIATWVIASLWIPVLLYAELWRVDQRAGSLHYSRVWWSAVFPLGMYSAATGTTALQMRLPPLTTISLVFFWIALTVWVLVAVGLAHVAIARTRKTHSERQSPLIAPRHRVRTAPPDEQVLGGCAESGADE
jgi:tellurite resistance protein TehA-like permease